MCSLMLRAPVRVRILDFFSPAFSFWLTLLQKETQRPGSPFCPQGFRLPLPIFVCARAPPGWFLLTARRYEMYRTGFFFFSCKGLLALLGYSRLFLKHLKKCLVLLLPC